MKPKEPVTKDRSSEPDSAYKQSTPSLDTDVLPKRLDSPSQRSIGGKATPLSLSRPASTLTIAYAISITKDSPYLDGAIVLGHAIKLAHEKSQFKYALVAFVHPEVFDAREQLAFLGWRVLVREVPVVVSSIRGEYLRTHIKANGCCGERELLKLWTYTLTEYHRIVHLDMDSLVLEPMDELFDDEGPYKAYDALYTYDWNMARGGQNPPVQGGFLAVKPDNKTFDELVAIVLEGDYRPGGGWGGTKAGAFYGGMTIQGLMAYYYRILNPTKGYALNRCQYNCMADNPRDQGGFGKGKCRDGGEDCEDCRLAEIDTIKNVHFTICQKPWECFGGTDCFYCPICRKLHAKWHAIRRDLESTSMWNTYNPTRYSGAFDKENYHGFCSRGGKKGYNPIPLQEVLSRGKQQSIQS